MHLRRTSKLTAILCLSAASCFGQITTSPNGIGLPLGLTGATAATRWVGATTTLPPVSGTFAIGDYVTTRDGNVYICTAAGTPGTWKAPLSQLLLSADGTKSLTTDADIAFASGVTGWAATGGSSPTTLTLGSSLSINGGVAVVFNKQSSTGQPVEFCIAMSDETNAITNSGNPKVTWRAPYAFTITSVKASLTTASVSGDPTVDINESGSTILSTKLTIDANEKTSVTAAIPVVISDTAIAADAEITMDVDVAGTDAAGLKIWIAGYR